MFRQGLCRGQAAAAGRPGCAGANGLRPFRRRRAPPGLRPSSANRRHPQARRLRRLLTRSTGRPAAFTGRRHPPAPRSPLQGPGSGRSPPPSGRQTAPAGPFRRCGAPPGLRPAPRLCKAARPRFLPKTGPHCVVIPYPGCRRCRAAGYPPGTPAKRRRRWRCGSSYHRSPAAVPQPRCRRRR